MPHKLRTPSFRLHKPTGQAVVTLNGRDHYLGRYSDPKAQQAYDRLVADWLARGRMPALEEGPQLTIVELSARFLKYAHEYYRDPETGEPTAEYHHFPVALKPLIAAYGRIPAAEFGPLRFKSIRDAYVRNGWSRKHVNSQADRIRRMFRWAVGEELVPASVYDALRAIPALKRGRTDAPDNPPVRPVPLADVHATKAFLSAPLRLAVDLQLITAARPGEILALRPVDVDRSEKDVWVYKPRRHKSEGHGHERRIYLGPKAQALLAPYLVNRKSDDFIISPREAVRGQLEGRSAARKTPLSCGNRPGTNRKSKPEREPSERYDTAGYRRAIARACARAFPVPPEIAVERDKVRAWNQAHAWHPHQLRHTAATELRREFGLEVASILMGHRDVGISQVYALRDESKAREVARKIG